MILEGDYLPPAPYSIVKQVNGRGMYSILCQGGVILLASMSPVDCDSMVDRLQT